MNYVTVRPLEWSLTAKSDGDWLTTSYAESLVGRYEIHNNTDGHLRVMLQGRRINYVNAGEGQRAKAVAQADYEARILSALSHDPALAAEAELAKEREQVRGLMKTLAAYTDRALAAEAERDRLKVERDAESRNAGRYADEALALRGDIAAADALRIMWHDRALTAAEARVELLEAEVARIQSDREYIIGFNAGWDEAAEQTLTFPTMLRKMWSGGEVQKWIDQQMSELRAAKTLTGASDAG